MLDVSKISSGCGSKHGRLKDVGTYVSNVCSSLLVWVNPTSPSSTSSSFSCAEARAAAGTAAGLRAAAKAAAAAAAAAPPPPPAAGAADAKGAAAEGWGASPGRETPIACNMTLKKEAGGMAASGGGAGGFKTGGARGFNTGWLLALPCATSTFRSAAGIVFAVGWVPASVTTRRSRGYARHVRAHARATPLVH